MADTIEQLAREESLGESWKKRHKKVNLFFSLLNIFFYSSKVETLVHSSSLIYVDIHNNEKALNYLLFQRLPELSFGPLWTIAVNYYFYRYLSLSQTVPGIIPLIISCYIIFSVLSNNKIEYC